MLIDTLVKETLKSVKRFFLTQGLNTNESDEIILVGGSTLIPYIKFMVENFFNKKTFIKYKSRQCCCNWSINTGQYIIWKFI